MTVLVQARHISKAFSLYTLSYQPMQHCMGFFLFTDIWSF